MALRAVQGHMTHSHIPEIHTAARGTMRARVINGGCEDKLRWLHTVSNSKSFGIFFTTV